MNHIWQVNVTCELKIKLFCFFIVHTRAPDEDEGGRGEKERAGGPWPSPLFLKLNFARDVFLGIRFCAFPQGIQNFFNPGIPKIFSGGLRTIVWIFIVVKNRYLNISAALKLLTTQNEPKRAETKQCNPQPAIVNRDHLFLTTSISRHVLTISNGRVFIYLDILEMGLTF